MRRAMSFLCVFTLGASLGLAQAPRFGLGFDASTLGLGIEGAVRTTDSTNFRLGFNSFNYGRTLNHDGLNYGGRLDLQSLHASFDWFFWGGLHLSPGVMLYNNNHATAGVSVPSGQQFSLGGTTYTSGSTPVGGSGLMNFSHAGPMLTLGWGNMVPRDGAHLSFHFETGVAYQSTPQVALNLTGIVCDSTGTICQPVASYPGLPANIQQEEQNLQQKLHLLKTYPILSFGLSYSFGGSS